FQWDVGQSFSIAGLTPLMTPDKLLEEWHKFFLNIQLLVGTFERTGHALLYLLSQDTDQNGRLLPKVVHLCAFPGYQTIGTGSENANFWLNYRRQVLGLSVERSAYHAFEAKKMAAKAP